MSWKRWNWLSVVVLPLALSVLRSCWLWLCLELARRWMAPSQLEPILYLPLMMGLFLSGMAATRLALRSEGNLRRARLSVAGLGLTAILVVLWWQFFRAQYRLWDIRWIGALGWRLTHWSDELPVTFVALIAAAYLWLQGMLDGRSSLYNENVWSAFGIGFLAMALPLLLAKVTKLSPPLAPVNLVFLFFAAGMAALAITGLQRANSGLQELQIGVRRYWLVSVVSIIVGLLGLGLVLSALIAPETVAQALRWTSAILDLLSRALYLVLLVVSYIVFLFLEPLIKLLRALLKPGEGDSKIEMPDFQRQFEELTKDNAAKPAIWEGFRWIGLGLLILVIGLIFAWALRRFWERKEEGVEETREIILSRDLLQNQLAALWREWLRRLRRKATAVLSPFLSLEGEVPTRRLIRAIYQTLLSAATELGTPRLRSQTPTEYQHALESELPQAHEMLNTLTGGYLQARYAAEPPTLEQAELAQQAWDQIRPMLRPESAQEDDEGISS